jgi:hypothetical protein
MSIEWLWFGSTKSLSDEYRKRIEIAEKLDVEHRQNLAEMDKIREKLSASAEKRKKALHPVKVRSRA